MPELPEVETVRRQLAPRLEGRTLARLDVLDPRWCAPEAPDRLAAAVAARRIQRLGRRGKYLIWELSGDRHLLVHLRMTGTLRYRPTATAAHTRVRFAFDDGAELHFVDPRRFGTGVLLEGLDACDAHLALRLGVEPLGPEFTAAHLRALARGCRAPIKAFLLDQRRIAGVGNIYADEALFRAGIHPLRPAGRLTGAQLAGLRDAVVASLQAGIDAGGATIDDFRHVDGDQGSFQDRFLVHRRAGEPCPACARPIRKLLAAGRGTYVCEGCQPRPRPRRSTQRSGVPGSSAARTSSTPA